MFDLQVVGIGDTGEEEDLVPSSGTVVFASGQASKRLQLTVVADEVSYLCQRTLLQSSLDIKDWAKVT